MYKKLYNRTRDEKIRINKYLSEAGICSRREADRMIEEGRITVNGKKAESGQKVSLEDEVCADNIPVHKNEKKVLLLFNKPRGIVCSTKQQFDETTVTDYLDYPLRVYPVGRLDKESQGLLLLTNEGDLVNKIMRAGNYHEKEYFVTVNKPVDREFVRRMSKGVPVLDTVTRPCRVVQTGECSFRIILTQGLNRQIRRMCEYFGYRVQKLVRVRIMNIELGDLESGKYRDVTPEEFKKLKQLIAHSSNQPVRPMEKSQKSKRKPRNSAIHGTYTVVNHHIDRENKNGNRKATD